MSKRLTIQGKVIDFPTSAQSPNWADALVEFAAAVQDALTGLAGTYDVPPQILAITSDVNNNVNVPFLSFSTSIVRGAFVRYAFQRLSDTTAESESGTLQLIYDDTAGTWQISRESVGSDNQLSFSVTNTGQVQFTTAPIGGTYNTGTLTYTAQALLKSN